MNEARVAGKNMHGWTRRGSSVSLVVLLLLALVLLGGAQGGQEDDDESAGVRSNVTVSADEDTLHVVWRKPDRVIELDIRSYEVTVKSKQVQETVVYTNIPSSQTSTNLGCLRPQTTYTASVRYKLKNNTNDKGELGSVEVTTLKEGIISNLRKHKLYVIIGAVGGALSVLLLTGALWCACRGLSKCGRRRHSLNISFDPPSAKDLREIEQRSFFQRRRNVYTSNEVRSVSSSRSHSGDARQGPARSHQAMPVPASQRTPLIKGSADLKACFPTSLPLEPAPPRPHLPAGKRSGLGHDEDDEDSFDSDVEGYFNSALDNDEPPLYGNVSL